MQNKTLAIKAEVDCYAKQQIHKRHQYLNNDSLQKYKKSHAWHEKAEERAVPKTACCHYNRDYFCDKKL